MSSQHKVNTVGRSPLNPGYINSISLPTNAVRDYNCPPKASQSAKPTEGSLSVDLSRSPKRASLKRRADKENIDISLRPAVKKGKLQKRTAHVGDHSITATEVSSQILADGLDATLIGQGADILKQYIDTFFGPVPGFNFNAETLAFDANSIVGPFESPGRPWAQENFTAAVNLPRPRQRNVQYTRIIGSRCLKASDVDINIPEVYQHGVVVPSKIGERVTNILPWARRSFENMARISLTGLERFDCSM